MRVTCPNCHAEASLDVMLGRDDDAKALADLLDMLVPALRGVLVQYLGLFRPGKRRLSMARAASLARELLVDIQRGAVARKGRDWAVTPDMWRTAMEQVLAMRDKGSLTLPLTGHGYLAEVLCGLADKAEAADERQTEADRRSRPHSAGATAVADVLQSAAAPAAATPVPYDQARGPSRAAREIQARIAAHQAARASTTTTEGDA
jgi:hypothetical protein